MGYIRDQCAGKHENLDEIFYHIKKIEEVAAVAAAEIAVIQSDTNIQKTSTEKGTDSHFDLVIKSSDSFSNIGVLK